MSEGGIYPGCSYWPQQQHQNICEETSQVNASTIESIARTHCESSGSHREPSILPSQVMSMENGDTLPLTHHVQETQAHGQSSENTRKCIRGIGIFDLWLSIWHCTLLFINTFQLQSQDFSDSTSIIWRFVVGPLACLWLFVFGGHLLLGLESEFNKDMILHCRIWIYSQPVSLLYYIIDLTYTDHPSVRGNLKTHYQAVISIFLFVRLAAILLVKYFISTLQKSLRVDNIEDFEIEMESTQA